MTNTTKLILEIVLAFCTIISLIATGCFWLATQLKEAEIKKNNAQTLDNLTETVDRFRSEIKKDLHYFREETDSSISQFKSSVQKSLSSYKVKQGLTVSTINEIIAFLAKNNNFKQRKEQLSNDFLPTDFTDKSNDNQD